MIRSARRHGSIHCSQHHREHANVAVGTTKRSIETRSQCGSGAGISQKSVSVVSGDGGKRRRKLGSNHDLAQSQFGLKEIKDLFDQMIDVDIPFLRRGLCQQSPDALDDTAGAFAVAQHTFRRHARLVEV